MVERKYFSQEQAEAKLGRRIRTRVPWSGVPEGTTGAVVSADLAGESQSPFGEAAEAYDVAVQWDLPREPLQVVADEHVLIISGGKPLVDWFTRDEYERYLEELNGEKIDRGQAASRARG